MELHDRDEKKKSGFMHTAVYYCVCHVAFCGSLFAMFRVQFSHVVSDAMINEGHFDFN